jgi:hypothetical protein
MPINTSSEPGFRKFTAADLPPGYDTATSKDAIPYLSENRSRSLQNKFIASFYPDGQLEFYACLVEGLNSEACSLDLQNGIEKGTSSVGGVTAFYEAGRWFDVANGHEDKVGPETYTEEDWSSWVTREIASVHRKGTEYLRQPR